MSKRRFQRNAKVLNGSKLASLFRSNPFPDFSVEQSQRIAKVLSLSDDLVNELGSFLMTANQENGLASETSPCPVELIRKYGEFIGKYAEGFRFCFVEVQEIFKDMKVSRGTEIFRASYQTLAGIFCSSREFIRIAGDSVERGESKLPYVYLYMLLSSNFSTSRSLFAKMREEFVVFLSRHDDEDVESLCPCEHCQPKPPKEGGTTIH